MCFRDTPDSPARRWLLACCIGIVAVYAVFFLVCAFLMGPADQDQFLVFHEFISFYVRTAVVVLLLLIHQIGLKGIL